MKIDWDKIYGDTIGCPYCQDKKGDHNKSDDTMTLFLILRVRALMNSCVVVVAVHYVHVRNITLIKTDEFYDRSKSLHSS